MRTRMTGFRWRSRRGSEDGYFKGFVHYPQFQIQKIEDSLHTMAKKATAIQSSKITD